MNVLKPLALLVLATSILTAGAETALPTAAKPFTVPEVGRWQPGSGEFVPAGKIVTSAKDEAAARVAAMLHSDYELLTGVVLPTAVGKMAKGDICLQIKPSRKENPESYTIRITPDGVTLTSPTERGLYWATRTLLQLTESGAGRALPAGQIKDVPQYGMRGLMIDVGRKYIPMAYLYKLVDALAYYKMNTLHIHLNDNGYKRYFGDDWDKTQAAFRLESEIFPGLTARDGSYTKAEFRQFIKDAAAKGVEVVPEIDIPAHSLAFTRYKPELASTGANGRDHLDIFKPETHEFLEALLTEYLQGPDPVFAGPKFHIGTDEYQGDSATLEQFRAFTDRYIRFTEKFGKRAAIWGSLTHANGKTAVKSDGVLMYDWNNGYANPRDMIAQGFNLMSIPDRYVYIVPNAGYYYDYLNNRYLYDNWTPADVGGVVFTGDTVKRIEGGMYAVWNDHPNNGITVRDIHHRIMHSLPVMASKTWSAANVTVPYDTFATRSRDLSEAPGMDYLGRFGNDSTLVLERAEVLSGHQNLPIHSIGYPYTVEFDIEGADETPGAALFTDGEATFWLCDPISGQMGFSREGQLSTFRRDIRKGEKLHVKVTGTNKSTALYVNGRLVDDLNVQWVTYNDSKRKMAQVHTLFFPLQHTGTFGSRVTNLKVYNY